MKLNKAKKHATELKQKADKLEKELNEKDSSKEESKESAKKDDEEQDFPTVQNLKFLDITEWKMWSLLKVITYLRI